MSAAFDTNILVYACDKSEPRCLRIAQQLISDCREGVILWQVACEFLAASRKLQTQGFTIQMAWERLSKLMDALPLIVPGPSVLNRGYDLHAGHGVAFWDAMIFAACLDAGVGRIYSEDLPGCPVPGLEIVNPFRKEG